MAETTAEQTYRIRALEWRHGSTGRYTAEVVTGIYTIEADEYRRSMRGRTGTAWGFDAEFDECGPAYPHLVADVPAAKLAAEAHWRATILPALEPA